MRIVCENVADLATLSAATTAGTLVPANLQNERKAKVHRSTGTSMSITAIFPVAKVINMLALCFTNLTASATVQVRGYTNSGDTTPAWTIAAATCVAPPYATRADGRGANWGVNTFGLGWFTHAVRWFTGGTVAKVIIDVTDGANPWGYLEAGRLVLGDYWTPTYNPEYNATYEWVDTTKNDRNDNGDSWSDQGFKYKKLTMNFSLMPIADRKRMSDLLRVNGLTSPFFLSIFPGDADIEKEHAHQAYGKLSSMSRISLPSFDRYAWPLEIEEV
jgi:hypothetical protein